MGCWCTLKAKLTASTNLELCCNDYKTMGWKPTLHVAKSEPNPLNWWNTTLLHTGSSPLLRSSTFAEPPRLTTRKMPENSWIYVHTSPAISGSHLLRPPEPTLDKFLLWGRRTSSGSPLGLARALWLALFKCQSLPATTPMTLPPDSLHKMRPGSGTLRYTAELSHVGELGQHHLLACQS